MLLKDLKIFNKNIISMSIIGSYNTEYWRVNRSDIDINKNIISMSIIGSYNTEYWRVNRSDIDN